MCRCILLLIVLSIAILLMCHKSAPENYADTPANLPHFNPIDGTIQEAVGWNDPEYTKTNGFVNSDVPYNYYLLDDGYGGASSILHDVCSPSCCNKQYETSVTKEVMDDPNVNHDDYTSSNMTCTGGGCICMTKQQQKYLENRGGNRA